MYELNRARLVAVGPRAARYTDVTLDLSGIGAPAEHARTLFGATRRPSPTSLLVLENGGGKTVLLKLLFSVLMPGRRKALGGSGNSMEKFVVDTDLGHVALEWMHVGTGELVVTGKALQRRPKPAAGQSTVAEAWYSFRPGTSLTLDTLPLAEDGRRRRLDGYRDTLMELNRAEAGLQLNWASDRELGQWTRHLRELGLEPDLFDIQRSMNVDEGDAANPFTFRTSAEFINWLLTTVTDPADVRAVVDTFDQWAETLAGRSAMLLERDFLDGAIAGLDPLAEAHAAAQNADREATTARTDAARMVAALHARTEQEQHEAASLGQRLSAARTDLVSAETARDRGREVLNEIERLTLLLELAELHGQQQALQRDLDDSVNHVEAWRIVPAVHASTAADAEAAAIADLLHAKNSEAAPALTRRDTAAGALLAALAGDAADRDAAAKRYTDEAGAAAEDAALARGDEAAALGDQGRLRERLAAHQRLIRATDIALAEAETRGHVPAGTGVGDLPRLVEQTRTEHDRLAGELAEARATVRTARDETAASAAAEKAARGTQQKAAAAAAKASSARQAADQAADRVAALPALRELTGLGPEEQVALGELDVHADQFIEQLRTAADTHQGALNRLGIDQERDQRVLDALGDGGLLPAREAVEDAVAKLTGAGVIAYPGWAYLAQAAPPQDRAALIDAHPDLADGVVVLDAGQLDRARELLEREQLLPAAAVTVGTGVLLLNLVGPPADRFVIEPTPALYDTDAADQRRDALATTMAARTAHIDELVIQRDQSANTAAQLQAWRATSPPGHLARLADEERRTSDEADAARQAHEETEGLLTQAQQAQADAEQQLNDVRDAERAAADLLRDRDTLATRAQEAVAAAALIPELQQQIQQQARIADEAARNAQRLVQDASDLLVKAETARNAAAQLRQEMSEVESTTARPAEQRPPSSIAELRSAYASAHRLYLDAAPDDELKKRADKTARHAQKLRDDLKQHATAHVGLARTLLAGPDGAGQAAWERAADRARSREARLRADDKAITHQVGQKQQAVLVASRGGTEGRAGAWTNLPVEHEPTSVEHGRALFEQTSATQRELQRKVETALAARDSLDQQQRQAAERAAGFEQAHLPLQAVLTANTDPDAAPVDSDGDDGHQPPAAAPYAGTAAAASAAATAATAALTRTSREATRAREELAHRHEELVTFVRDDAYDKLRASVRSLIINSTQARVAGSAAEWSEQLMARRVSLQQDLDSVDKHRATIVERLSALVDRALKTLRLAARLSKLPDTLGDWSGREFLHFGFSQPDLTTITTRVGDVIDDEAAAVSERVTAGRTPTRASRRDGMGLLLKAVHAAVPRGFAVTVLKPDQVLRDERVPVEEMGDVFSGGQELTAAIMLYCTLAAVKGNERGQMKVRHSGVLFLDNPIGKASARYLLDMQKQVAAALGVQLVYTTGLSDDRALAAFPLWIRMRNDADLRAGLKHIRVSDIVRAALPDPYDDTETTAQPGTVTAARVNLRPDRALAG